MKIAEWKQLFIKNPGLLTYYTEGMMLLERSTVIGLLSLVGSMPRISGKETIQEIASLGAYSSGYQAALDDLVHFREVIIGEQMKTATQPKPVYGADKLALESGYITKEEKDGFSR